MSGWRRFVSMNGRGFSRSLESRRPATASTQRSMWNELNFAASLESGVATCEETCKLAERKLEELKRKIAGYQRLAERIEVLLDSPCRREANADCSLVAALKNAPCKA